MAKKTEILIRDRIKEFRRIPASELLYNPKNYRKHPEKQLAALRGVLNEIGFAGAELARETPDGIMLIDGAARKQIMGNQVVPVLITDLSEEEADLLLVVHDPIGAMAVTDAKQLEELLRDVSTSDEDLSQMISEMAEAAGIIPEDDEEVELKQLSTKPPPVMSWVLVGIPTVRFGEIAQQVEEMASVDGILLETISNGK